LGDLALPARLGNAVKLNAWLIEHCRKTGSNTVSTRQIQQYGPGALRTSEALHAAIEELADADRVRVAKDGKRKELEINPALLRGSNGIA
jgi:putative DNA primase/helicase